MRRLAAILAALACSVSAQPSRGAENPLYAYPHMLPSPLTMPQGRLVLGTHIAYGLTDFLQIGTDVLRDFYRVYNANAKASILDFEEFATAFTLGFEHYNYKDIDSANPDLTVTSWQPGVVTAWEIVPDVATFIGGNLGFTQTSLIKAGIKSSGYVRGANAEWDLSWAYNPKEEGKQKKRRIGNVVSGGVSYDFSYDIFGFGVSHYWPGFHLGIHYYPNADKYKVAPIISGGAVLDL